LFLGLRAGIRARVAADRAGQEGDGAAERDRDRARKYLLAARRFLTPCPPQLAAIGGLSGTGKSMLGAALAPRTGSAPGAVHLRSDLERKALFRVEETVRLPSEAYTSEATNMVYENLRKKARLVLGAGHSAIADAVYSTPAERSGIEAIASEMSVPFRGLWLTADRDTLVARVDARRNDASDATLEIVEQQLARDIGKLSPAWTTVDASGSADETRRHALFALGVDSPRASTSEGSGGAP
jgi:predicted kinase